MKNRLASLKNLKGITWVLALLILCGLLYLSYWLSERSYPHTFAYKLFLGALLVGFFAQAIDGALGMAYGVVSNTFLLSLGLPPATATASVHIAETFTTAASGLSHWKMGNIDRKLFLSLLVPGITGALLGAYAVSQINGQVLRPWIAAYLLLLGCYILYRSFRKIVLFKPSSIAAVPPLAVFGAFVDSVGGGGWGPIVTTSLVSAGKDPRYTIGSVNAAEFFITLAAGGAFMVFVSISHWEVIAGLIVGGLFAAPLAAVLTRRFTATTLLRLVGSLVIVTSIINLYKSLS